MGTKKVYDPRFNIAKSKQRYVGAWGNHITELTSVLLEAGIPANEWDAILLPLRDAVDTAAAKLEADNCFPEGF